jgi:hypothetical protein
MTGLPENSEFDSGGFPTAATTGLPFWVPSFTPGALFGGPEFSDVQEVAQVTITSLSLGTRTFRLINTYDAVIPPDTALWDGYGAAAILSPSTGAGGGPCTNPSDFTLVQLQYETVPEPGTCVLLGAGLIALGLLARRRKG